MKWLLFFLLVSCVSCSLFDGMKKTSFSYGEEKKLTLVIPKGFRKKSMHIDSTGNKTQVFLYGNGCEFYFISGDGITEYVPIDTSAHIAKYYPGGVAFYKGQDSSTGLFWRESRYKNFRFGYKNVSLSRAALFDSSVNGVGWSLIK